MIFKNWKVQTFLFHKLYPIKCITLNLEIWLASFWPVGVNAAGKAALEK